MTTIRGQSFAFNVDLRYVDIRFEQCNFTQVDPFMELDVDACIFEHCNLCNCKLSDTNTYIDCNRAQYSIEETDLQIITTFYDLDGEVIRAVEEDK